MLEYILFSDDISGAAYSTRAPMRIQFMWHRLSNWPPQETASRLMKNFRLKINSATAPVPGKLSGNKRRAAQARFLYYTTQQGGKYVIPKNAILMIVLRAYVLLK